jgi:cleavage stimulation factor subunit 3
MSVPASAAAAEATATDANKMDVVESNKPEGNIEMQQEMVEEMDMDMDMDMDDDETYVRPTKIGSGAEEGISGATLGTQTQQYQQQQQQAQHVVRGLPGSRAQLESQQQQQQPPHHHHHHHRQQHHHQQQQQQQASRPLTKVEQLQRKVAVDAYDTDAWSQLIMEYQNRPIGEAREVYETFLRIYPTAGRYWKYYAEQELAARNYDAAEKIFMRCLPGCPMVELWKCYLKYILDTKAKQPNAKDLVIHAFEYALANVGLDISATTIWIDYINYLKTLPTTLAWTDSHKMDALRKAYQRAIENPMHNVESIWKEYDQFENSLNKTLAAGLLKEHGPKYMSARSTYRERKNHIEGISKNVLARPPRGFVREAHQLRLWKRLIDYEKANPQRLDPEALIDRVTFTYNQALMALYHYPEIWHQAAQYQYEVGRTEACDKVYARALVAMPANLLLHFEYCDFLELNGKVTEATALYDKLLAVVTQQQQQQQQQPSQGDSSSSSSALVWIQAMRFYRRTHGIQPARKIFFRARKSPTCTYHVYVAAGTVTSPHPCAVHHTTY